MSGHSIKLVVDPHAQRVVGVEDDSGKSLGQATPLDAVANCHRRRRKGAPAEPSMDTHQGANLVEIAHARYHGINGNGIKGDDANKGG